MDMQALMPQTERKTLKPCCKNKKLPWMEGTLGSTYKNDYIEKEVPVERAGPRVNGPAPGPAPKFDGTTTMGTDYKPYVAKREQPFLPVHTLGEHNPFAGDSTYKGDFGPKEVKYERVRPPNAFEPNNAAFDPTTTNRTDFQPRAAAPPQAIRKGANIPTSAGPFEGTSAYKDAYRRVAPGPRQAAIPNRCSPDVIPTGKFDAGTMYRTNFVPKEISVADKFRPQDARPMSAGEWFGGGPSTEYRGQFLQKDMPTTEPAKAMRGGDLMPKAPFDGTTTNKVDYKPYAVAPIAAFRPQHALNDEKAPFQGQSTYQGSFIPKNVPYQRVKPSNAFEPNSAPFDATTTNRTAFNKKDGAPPQRILPQRTSVFTEQHPFEGQSTYKDAYVKRAGQRAERKMMPSERMQTGPFDGTTTYRKDFIEKEIPRQARRTPEGYCESCVDGEAGVDCYE